MPLSAGKIYAVTEGFAYKRVDTVRQRLYILHAGLGQYVSEETRIYPTGSAKSNILPYLDLVPGVVLKHNGEIAEKFLGSYV